MDFKEKKAYAQKVAEELKGQKTRDQIESDLKAQGLYDRDVIGIMVSAKNILLEKYKPNIREYLMSDREIHGAEEFSVLDKDILDRLIQDVRKDLELEEGKRMRKLVKAGVPGEEVLKQVDNRFLSSEKASELLVKRQQLERQESGNGRMMNIGGGIGLIVLTGVVLLATDRLFYVLPILGLVMIFRGIIGK